MDVIIIMCLGVLAGRFFSRPRTKKLSETISVTCTVLLIFSMGVTLGRNENFLNNLSSLGLSSLLFFLVPTIFSIFIVFLLTKKMMTKKITKKREEENQ